MVRVRVRLVPEGRTLVVEADSVGGLLEALGLSRETHVVLRGGKPLLSGERLREGEEIVVVRVLSGGSPKCSFCGREAVVEIPYARLRLCRDHFLSFIRGKVERVIREYGMIGPGDRVLAAVSGGKDSASLAGILADLRGVLGFKLALIHLDLGIPGYSVESREKSVELAEALGVPYAVVSVSDLLGMGVPDIARRLRRKPCSVCGLVKRYILNAAAIEWGATRLATGHNADDIAAYALKAFLLQRLEDIPRQYPVSPTLEGLAVSRIKPLYTVYERESYLYALLRGLPHTLRECPHARMDTLEFRLKELLGRLEEDFPSIKLQFLRGLARRRSDYPVEPGEPVPCRYCGLISYGGECGFCRLTRRLSGEPLGLRVRGLLRELNPGFE